MAGEMFQKHFFNLKKQRIIERKKRSDAGKSRTIDEKLGKILKKRLYGKRGVGLKKSATEYNLSATGIRRWLHPQPWGKYQFPKLDVNLTQKNLKDS